MSGKKLFKFFLCFSFLSLFLLGCRAEERDRFVYYEPGVYKGKIDNELTEKQRRLLRQRSALQGSGITTSGPVASRKNVRKPDFRSSNLQSLKNRLRNQSDSGAK